jgi:hypothetical protein
VGAILKFATTLYVSGIDTIGVVLMLVGPAWLALTLSLFHRRRSEVVTQRRTHPTQYPGDQYVEEPGSTTPRPIPRGSPSRPGSRTRR